MPTLEDIKKQLEDLNKVTAFLSRKEIKELPSILQEDEKLEALIFGRLDNGNGVLVCTDRRLIFIDKGLLYGLKVKEFPIDKITSVSYKTGLMYGKFTITSKEDAVIELVDKNEIRPFAEHVTNKLNSKKTESSVNTSSEDDVVSKLERLAALKEKGILTDEEFLEQKTKILNS
jgi:hypothetical protein